MNKEKNVNNMFKSIIKGFIISIIASIVSIWIYAIILVKTNIQENTITTVIIGISGVSVLVGSTISCLKIKKNGILNGVCIGLLYFLSLYLLSSIALCGFGFSITALIILMVVVFLGGLGGVVGVNLKR